MNTGLAGPHQPPKLKPLPKPVSGKADPELKRAWHLETIKAFDAWKVSRGSHDTIVAIVDSGIDYNHVDLAPNLALNGNDPINGRDDDGNGYIDDYVGWDFIWGKGLPFDRAGHGTFLAGIAVSVEGNGTGSAGVCPECAVLPVRFLNFDGLGDTEDAIAGLYYAVKRGAKVINFSFAGEGYDKDLEKAIRYAATRDVLVVTSASNDGENLDYESIYPAKFNLPNLITVAATDREDGLWEGSNWGKRTVHIAAPGADIVGPWEGKWDTGSGTSDAAAIVSGAAGLIRDANPSLTAAQVKKILMSSARRAPSLKGKIMTEGVLDLHAAVGCAVQETLPCLR